MFCIVTGIAGGVAGWPRHGQEALRHGPTTRPGKAKIRSARAQGHMVALAWGLAGGGVAIQKLYRGWGRILGRDTAHDTTACTLRHDSVHAATRQRARCDTTACTLRHEVVSRHGSLCRDGGGCDTASPDATTRRASTCVRTTTRQGKATTRLGIDETR